MNRRHALRNMVLVSGSLITLPAWMGCDGPGTPTTHLSSFSSTEQHLLAAVTDTIIPAGNSIGALSLGVDKYLQKLIDKCHEKEVQENVKTQLKALTTSSNLLHAKPFTDCTQPQREQMLLKLSASENEAEKDFFNLMKSETIRGFNTSQEVMEKYHNYKIAPAHYYGCVELKS